MQLLCNNVFLDLYDNAGFQFKYDNPLFAFDDLKCERTTQFKLPCTPKNNKAFDLAGIPAYNGAGMRVRYEAQLQAGAVVKDGHLYITACDGKDYTAIFVTGELLGLQAIRDIGYIDECGAFDDDESAVAVDSAGISAHEALSKLWEKPNYLNSDGLHASISIPLLLSKLGITDKYGLISASNLRWIPKEMKPVQDEYLGYNITCHNESEGAYSTTMLMQYNVSVFSLQGSSDTEYFMPDIMMEAGFRASVNYTHNGITFYGYVVQCAPKYNMRLLFASGFPSDCFIGYFNPTEVNVSYSNLSAFTFLGGYSFDADGNVTGTPLAGRLLDIAAGTKFCIIRKSWYTSEGWNIGTPAYDLDGNLVNFIDYADNPPAIWRLRDNLPHVTAIDMLKIVAQYSGCVLYYTDADGVCIDWDILSGEIIDITKNAMSVTEVKREFADYAQHNIVTFAEDDAQYAYEKQSIDYTINNANLEQTRDLYVAPAGNGGYKENGQVKRLSIRGEQQVPVLGGYIAADTMYLQRVEFSECADIQALCDASTSVKARARMTLYEYEQIKPKTRILLNGTLYMWTSRSWQKNEAQFTLAKVL